MTEDLNLLRQQISTGRADRGRTGALGAGPVSNRQAGGDVLTIHQVPRNGPIPLAVAQERFWFLHQLDPQSAADNVAAGLRMEGPLDTSLYREAWAHIFRRHEILRTRFVSAAGVPTQVIDPPGEVIVDEVDMRQLPGPAREEAATRQASLDADLPFDLAHGPTYRLRLYRVADDCVYALVVFHHIVCDLWSLGVMSYELSHGYAALAEGREPRLRKLPFQYADYAVCHREWSNAEAVESQIVYWREHLAGHEPNELPTDRPVSALPGNGATGVAELPAATRDAVKDLAARAGLTPFMILGAAFVWLMSRYTGHSEVTIGTPIANRTRLELKGVIGTFVNTLVLRVETAGAETFEDLLDRFKHVALDAFANQDVSFHRLVNELRPERPLRRGVFFQALFNVQNVPIRVPQFDGVHVRTVTLTRRASQFDFGVWVDTDVLQQVGYAFDESLFDPGTIERFVTQYVALVNRLVAAPGQRLVDVDILQPDERRQVLVDWNSTARSIPSETVVSMIEAQAGRQPAKTAIVCQDRTVSYLQLTERAAGFAAALKRRGIGPGKLVAVCLPRTEDLVVVLLGILKAGAAYLPLDPRLPAARREFMVEDSGADLLIVADEDSWHGESAKTVHRRDLIPSSDPVPSGAPARPDDLAYVIYTSGSTGHPKGVEIEHHSLTNFLYAMQDELSLSADDVLLAVTTVSFDISALELYLPLTIGATTVIADRDDAIDPERLVRELARQQVTVMQATPTTWRMLLDAGCTLPAELTILCGGERLSRALADRLLANCKTVWNLYGPTETTIWSTVHQVQEGTAEVPVGHPIANTQLYVLDERRQPVPIGVHGELYIGGSGVARGYRGRPTLTEERFVPDPFAAPGTGRLYRTGDVARYRANGVIEIAGRIDDQVKIRGFRVELAEIELVLNAMAGVSAGVVVVRQPAEGHSQLVAFVVPEGGSALTNSGIRDRLATVLPHYMVPQMVRFVSALPTTASGKIDRKALAALGEINGTSSQAASQWRSDTERELATIWAEELDLPWVNALDDFFDLGGHSLLAVRLATRIQLTFEVPLDVATLISARTVRHLAREIERRSGPVRESR